MKLPGSIVNVKYNGGLLTLSSPLACYVLQSTAAGDASVGQIASGAITGTVTVQRYLSGGSLTNRGYRLLSSPVDTATVGTNKVYSINNILNSSFLTGTDGTAGGFSKAGNPTLYLYRESLTTGTGATFTSGENFRGIKNIKQTPAYNYLIDVDGGPYNITAGSGYLFFFRGASSTVNPYVIEFTVPCRLGNLQRKRHIEHGTGYL